ncbi:hypothetical protein ABEF95_013740 [Exophiala dermatitidis]|uniref:CFEM domain-containing protein n=1 Tax=Exophiala dermatitidis (strain ATCC 34100 / CBS 525.76 / NIH/UT8656) TaxID=858893 RepID=H6CAP0_EXODN|nr:uncharacterized protein HMPREF1120_08781 [Exophiala dermatitidis NIH/UT8656]EHY60837.1 hypothetical protein HMPREF1120_08781 [Exophiala dermatitidis NIH/UT8656]
MYLIPLLFVQLTCFLAVQAISVQDIPQCAQQCLSNSTTAQTQCSVIDIGCLCSNTAYVSTLSCCLYQKCSEGEQATAIQFNKQECAAVNETAPDFVGCSPAGLSSALASASALGVAPVTGSATASSVTGTSSSLSSSSPSSLANSGYLTVSGDVVPETVISQSGKTPTATFAGRPLMTGSCTVPYFAIVTNNLNAAMVTEFPAIGCSDERADCCPFDPNLNQALTRCPQDYFTTANGCCPIGFQVYYTAIGAQTPCYSDPATKFIPASTPTISGLTLITDHVFSQMYMLAKPSSHGVKLPLGAKIGIAVNAVLFVGIIIALIFFIRRRRMKAAAAENARSTTFPPQEPALQMSEAPNTHELDSPEAQTTTKSPGTPGDPNWPIFPASSPPAYEHPRAKPLPSNKLSPSTPQELPGSTYIHEHHPAYSSGDSATEVTAPSSPPRTPVQQKTQKNSPVLSALTPRSGNQSPPFVSPLGSPRLPQTPP